MGILIIVQKEPTNSRKHDLWKKNENIWAAESEKKRLEGAVTTTFKYVMAVDRGIVAKLV